MVLIYRLPCDEEIDTFERECLKDTYHFTNRDLLRQALQATGLFGSCGNKALALTGDALLRLAIVDQGQERGKSRGEVDIAFKAVASNHNLYEQGIALGLDTFIVKHPGQYGVMAGKNVMATTMEAIVGAVYYDSNKKLDDCKRVMAALSLSWPE